MKVFLACFGTVMIAAVSAYAGGLADTVLETAPIVMTPDQPRNSVPNWVIPVAIVALLLGAASLSGNDDDGGAS